MRMMLMKQLRSRWSLRAKCGPGSRPGPLTEYPLAFEHLSDVISRSRNILEADVARDEQHGGANISTEGRGVHGDWLR